MSPHLNKIKDIKEEISYLRKIERKLNRELQIAERNEQEFGLQDVVSEIYQELDLLMDKIYLLEKEIDQAYDDYYQTEGRDNTLSRQKELFETTNLL